MTDAAMRIPPHMLENSPEEDAAIRRAMEDDPDSWEIMTPRRDRRGFSWPEPIFLDTDVIKALKAANPDHWREKANEILREALSLPAAE